MHNHIHIFNIHNPVNLKESIGTFFTNDFLDLKDVLSDVVQDRLYDLWLHKVLIHSYKFDGSALQDSSIFAITKKYKEGEMEKTKITASCLASINTPEEFEKHVKTLADTVCKRSSKATSKASNKTSKKELTTRTFNCVSLL